MNPAHDGYHLSWARGTLLGLAVGDALGTTLEFVACEAPPFPTLARGPHTDITGGGPFALAPGQVTDDTHMATLLAMSLRAHGRLVASDVAQRYIDWIPHTFDIGNLTHTSLSMIARGVSLGEAARRAWLHSDKRTAGNGSLMRTAPIAVAFHDAPAHRRLASLTESAITHYDPRCRLACAAFNAAIAAAAAAPQGAAEMLAAAEAEVEEATQALVDLAPADGPEALAARDCLRADLEAARRDDPALYGPELHIHRHEGFVRVAFRLAFWELLHAPSFAEGLVDAVNRGGDADTNGAVAGALLGARFGESAIPEAWRARVLDALQDGPPGPLRDLYHPRRLLELVGEG
jgi:ADP-ribosylglycohydrolase